MGTRHVGRPRVDGPRGRDYLSTGAAHRVDDAMVDVQIERPTTSVTDDAAALADSGVSLKRGVAALRAALGTMPAGAGVYCMRDRHEKPLYIGKAKSLRKRVATYVNVRTLSVRLQRMIAGTASVEVVTTEGEVEALLLESNMIKRLKPHYNILLRDDKSFPYILLRRGHRWPQIAKYRGAKSADGDYFGPVRIGRRGGPHDQRAAARLPAALVLGLGAGEPHAALPAISDQALHRALRRPHRQGRL